ncbi:conserved protein of unknown function [Sterolibacterium denitrificans]|uniref:DUF2249 domain-containing protein n=1 Tax=Sterolibacterium denitrificans TaxID=157592 RepID=A0A7Z7MVL3_9PROT|nr:DUF2249 domain-containing protein [Sterolibacterium denitrificans]SMB27978.1 conserved protein of unknown function [Sterolibacterium denitrificans]
MALDPLVIDGRNLQPPEPLELTLAALDTLQPGQELLLLLHCEPHPLYSILRRNGYRYVAEFKANGDNEIRISKA